MDFRWGKGGVGSVFPHDIFHGNCLPHPTIPHLSLPTKFTCSKQSLTILEAGVLGRCSTRERTWAVPEAAGVPWEEGRLKKETANKLSCTSLGRVNSVTFAKHGSVTPSVSTPAVPTDARPRLLRQPFEGTHRKEVFYPPFSGFFAVG